MKVGLSHHIVDLANGTIENDKPVVFSLDNKTSSPPQDEGAGEPEQPPKKKQKKSAKTKKTKDKGKDKKARLIDSS